MNPFTTENLVREGPECQARFQATQVGQVFLGYDNEYWIRIQPLLNPNTMGTVNAILVQSSDQRRIGMAAHFGNE